MALGFIGDIGKAILGPVGQEIAGALGGQDRYKPKPEAFDVPGYGERAGRFQEMGQKFGTYGTPQVDPSVYEYWKSKMRGEDSLSQRHFEQARGEARKFALAQAATGRGNPALAARLASQQYGDVASGMAGQAATAGIQERAAAGQLAAGMAGQNLGAALEAERLRQSGMFGAGGLELQQALGQQMGGISREQLQALIAMQPGLMERFAMGLGPSAIMAAFGKPPTG